MARICHIVRVTGTFWRVSCEKTKALSYDVKVSESGGDTIVQVQREMPADDVPDIARKFVGQTLTVVQTETWHPANADGSRDADVKGEIANTPVTLKGTARIASNGSETVQSIDLDVKVALAPVRIATVDGLHSCGPLATRGRSAEQRARLRYPVRLVALRPLVF